MSSCSARRSSFCPAPSVQTLVVAYPYGIIQDLASGDTVLRSPDWHRGTPSVYALGAGSWLRRLDLSTETVESLRVVC